MIKAARKHLARLESQALDATPHLDLFALPCEEDESDEEPAAASSVLHDALAAIDPDALTPREALDQLYQLKRMAAQ
ncbi:hypothetical protein LP420_30300 [Massilia sp. B-10]|nr:hypothetical protein LP420_30300 [Massilia sp. B-10]